MPHITSRSLTKDSAAFSMLTSLFFLGCCWKPDLMRIISCRYSQSGASDALKLLKEKGYVTVTDRHPGARHLLYDAVSITEKGTVFLSESEGGYYAQHRPDYRKRFGICGSGLQGADPSQALSPRAQKRMYRLLCLNRVRSMFDACGICVYPADKPSLYSLYCTLYQGGDPDFLPDQRRMHDPFYVSMDRQECLSMMNDQGGVFYSSDEFRDFLKSSGREGLCIQLRSSRFKGIWISGKSCCAVYLQTPRSDRMIGISLSGEIRLVNILENCLGDITDIFRPLTHLGRDHAGVSGMVISNSSSAVYGMVTGYRRGIVKSGRGGVYRNGILMAGTPVYDMLHVIPATYAGVRSLGYLTHSTPEKLHRDTQKYSGEFRQADPEDKIIYLPFYEVNYLKQLSEHAGKYTVITYREMADAISHSLRHHDIGFYDPDLLIPISGIRTYRKDGHPEPADSIADRNRCISEAAGTAGSGENMEVHADSGSTVSAEESGSLHKRKKRIARSASINIRVDNIQDGLIRHAAELEGSSISRMVKRAALDYAVHVIAEKENKTPHQVAEEGVRRK